MNKLKPRLLYVMLFFAVLFSGCTSAGSNTPTSLGASYHKFGFSCMDMSNPYYVALESVIREKVEAKGNYMTTLDPKGEPDLQIDQIDQLIEEGIEVIFLCPVSSDSMKEPLTRLKEANVKVIIIDSKVKETSFIDAYIGSDNEKAGKLCADALIKQGPKGGKVAIFESSEINSITERIAGFENELRGKGFNVSVRKDILPDINSARVAADEIFDSDTELDVIMCGNDLMAQGVLVSANMHNLDDLMIFSVDGSPDIKKELIKGRTLISGSAAQSPISIGTDAVDIAFKILAHEEYERFTYEDVFFIDSTNVKDYGVDEWQ